MLQFLFPASGRATRQNWALAMLFVSLLAAEMFGLKALVTSEHRLIDSFMRQHAAQYRADPDIVIVDIDDPSMTAMQQAGGLWPWPREIHADLLEGLAEFEPRAVIFDMAFSERDIKRPKSDARLVSVIKNMPAVYLPAVRLGKWQDAQTGTPLAELKDAFGPAYVGSGTGDARAAIQLPHAIDRATWRLGLINTIEDDDGVLRRYALHTDPAKLYGWRLPSMPARVARDLGKALPDGKDALLRWPKDGHKRYPYGELYRLLTEQRQSLQPADAQMLRALFHNKIIVIGASAATAFDHHLTPLDAGYPGVDILAIAIDNLKNGQSVRQVARGWPFLFGIVLIVAIGFAFTRRVNPLSTGGALAAISLAALAISSAALSRNLQIPVVTPLAFAWIWFLLAAVAGYLRERRSREQAVSLFRRFLNPAVVRQIVDQGATIESLSGRTCNITVLFSDIRGFTTLSESRPPHEVVTLLNRYFEKQVDVVFRHGGTLDKFIGDCIMAFWGAPLDDPEHAQRAVAAALEMQEVLLAFRNELAAEGSSVGDFDVGIGVHTGSAVVGFIGAKRKLDYTAIGDTVNLASRVEGLTRGVARILVTNDTMLACGTANAIRFQGHGSFPVKGRTAAVELFEPIRGDL